jgi:hypothetical protein
MKFAISLRNRVFFIARSLVPAVFLHTQKTAGTTLIALARRFYKEDMISHGDYLALPRESLSKIAFVSGHFGYDYALPLIQSRYSFTFLRDPVERVLSFYYFCRNSDPAEYPIYRLAHELDLNDFLRAGLESPLVSAYLWNQQTWALACGPGGESQLYRDFREFPEQAMLDMAIAHLADFSHIGFTESFETDRGIIFAALKLPHRQEKWFENSNEHRPFKRDIPLPSLKLAEELTRLDRELYAAAWVRRWPNRPPP